MTHSILGRGASDRRSVRQASRQRHVVAASLMAGVVGATGVAMAPANAVTAGTTFYAQEIFENDHGPAVVTADCGGTTKIDMAKPADLPAGTTASIVVIGPLTDGKADADKCWVLKLGAVEIAVPKGTKVQKGPLPSPEAKQKGLVKVVAAAAVTADGTTKLVAEKVVNRKRKGSGAAEVEVAYVADLTAVTKSTSVWTVEDTGTPATELKLDVNGAEIDEGLGDKVTAQFLTAPAPAEDD